MFHPLLRTAAVGLLLMPPAAWAETRTIVAVRTSSLSHYTDAVQGFKDRLKQKGAKVELQDVMLPPDEKEAAAAFKTIEAGKPSLVLTLGTTATRMAKDALPNTPIVFCVVFDPRANGFTTAGVAMDVKPQEVIAFARASFPQLKRLAILHNPKKPITAVQEIRSSPEGKGIRFIPVDDISGLQQAVSEAAKDADAMVLLSDPNFCSPQVAPQIIMQTLGINLPIIAASLPLLKAGCLAAVHGDLKAEGRAAADIAIRIMEGESPASIPVQWSPKIRKALNLVVSRRLKIPIDPALAERMDEVIR